MKYIILILLCSIIIIYTEKRFITLTLFLIILNSFIYNDFDITDKSHDMGLFFILNTFYIIISLMLIILQYLLYRTIYNCKKYFNNCIICFSDKSNICFANCGHVCYCNECYNDINDIRLIHICPLCRTYSTTFMIKN